MTFEFVESEEYIREESKLETRFKLAKTVKGTLAYHCIIPITKNKAKAKQFSLQKHATEFIIMK